MIQVVTINGQELRFANNLDAMYAYEEHTGRSFLGDIASLESWQGKNGQPDMSKIKVGKLLDLIWAFAYAADEKIPPPKQRRQQFELSDIMELFQVIQLMAVNMMETKEKNA